MYDEQLAKAAMEMDLPECRWCIKGQHLGFTPERFPCHYCNGTGKDGGRVAASLLAGSKTMLRTMQINYDDNRDKGQKQWLGFCVDFIAEYIVNMEKPVTNLSDPNPISIPRDQISPTPSLLGQLNAAELESLVRYRSNSDETIYGEVILHEESEKAIKLSGSGNIISMQNLADYVDGGWIVELLIISPERLKEGKLDIGVIDKGCGNCHRCMNGKPRMKMIICPSCGNKRCPKASDHNLDCTNSNEPGQPGSIYLKSFPDIF